ncbi:MAG: hypothetical protein GY895_00250 [Phycisphaera sp.]|nr:hypothetical protein [Phycisphaera sp.]
MSLPTQQPEDRPVELPRGLVFGASSWLAASWLVSLGLRPPLQPTSTAYTPAARMMVVAIMIGIVVAWPLLRLSTPRAHRPLLSASLDTISLVSLTLLVIWPLRLVTTWSVDRLTTISMDLVANTILVGGLLAIVGVARRGATAAMIAVMILLVAPAVVALGTPIEPSLSPSPLVRIWSIASGGPAPLAPAAWSGAAVTVTVGLVLWLVANRIQRSTLADSSGLR